jgi:hypothetical protein
MLFASSNKPPSQDQSGENPGSQKPDGSETLQPPSVKKGPSGGKAPKPPSSKQQPSSYPNFCFISSVDDNKVTALQRIS